MASSAPTATFTKEDSSLPADAFALEAAGLRWLAAANGAAVAEVVGVAEHSLTTVRVERAAPNRAAAERFGVGLAATHAAGADAFCAPPPGWDGNGWIGRQRQRMQPSPSWGASFAAQRILPFMETARAKGNVSADAALAVERVCERLIAGEFDDAQPPARIHGDLWNGNVLWGADGVVVIDPAAQGGHRLTDLAMLTLFGCPHLDTVLDAYAEAASLPRGWRELLPVHLLHPLAVHAASHGRRTAPSSGTSPDGWARCSQRSAVFRRAPTHRMC